MYAGCAVVMLRYGFMDCAVVRLVLWRCASCIQRMPAIHWQLSASSHNRYANAASISMDMRVHGCTCTQDPIGTCQPVTHIFFVAAVYRSA
eukprot:366000-Chlamydomonas_euryale.AAC.15